jgi:hypothetical protein
LKESIRIFKYTPFNSSPQVISSEVSQLLWEQPKILLLRPKKLQQMQESPRRNFTRRLRKSKRLLKKLLLQEKLSSRDKRTSSWKWLPPPKRRLRRQKGRKKKLKSKQRLRHREKLPNKPD